MDASRDTGETVWMTPQEAANVLGVTPKTVYDRARDGRLHSKTVEGRMMVEVRRDTPLNDRDTMETRRAGKRDTPLNDVTRLLELIESLTAELKEAHAKAHQERERAAAERERTDAILMQQARTIDRLADENQRLKALPQRSWWRRLKAALIATPHRRYRS